MNSKLFFILSTVTLLGLSSCDKPDPAPADKVKYQNGTRTRVEGKVLEYGSNNPIPQAMVVLRESIYVPFSGGGPDVPIDTVWTDALGNFTYDFAHLENTADYNITYDLRIYKDKYFWDEWKMEKGYSYKNNKIILDPYAWIKVFVKNTMPFDEMDYLWLGSGGNYYGQKIDTFETILVYGNQTEELVWYIGKNKMQKKLTDSLFVKAHDTAQYHINY